jgi:hypothetical protein
MPGSPALAFQVINDFGSPAAESFAGLVAAAEKVMHDLQMTDVQSDFNARFVQGRTLNSHCVVTFVGGTFVSSSAVVMAAGDDAFPMVDQLAAGLRNLKFL